MRLAGLFLMIWGAFAQTRLSFEAASVKPAGPGRLVPLHGGPGTKSPGEISGAATMKTLVMRAYGLKSYQVTGPAWMDSEKYEIAAKPPAGASVEDAAAMLQSLLAERFRLVAHKETRQLPIYTMAISKSGPKLKQSTPAGEAENSPDVYGAPKLAKGSDGLPELLPGAALSRSYEVVLAGSDGVLYKLWARKESMRQLADRLSGQLNRPVSDQTGLTGQYDFTLVWTMEGGGTVPRTDPPPDQIESSGTTVLSDPGLSIFAAMQRQLGLRLEQGKGPLEILIIDHVERTPTEN